MESRKINVGGEKEIKSSVLTTVCFGCLLNTQIEMNKDSHLFLMETQEPENPVILEHPAEKFSNSRNKYLILPWRQIISLFT